MSGLGLRVPRRAAVAVRGENRWLAALPAAVVGWLAAHAVVALAVGFDYLTGYGVNEAGTAPSAYGLFAWDGGWYRAIGAHGYAALPPDAVRFFPLLPLVGRAGAAVGIPAGAAMVVVSNAAALGFALVVAVLAGDELADDATARRSAWLVQLVPGAVVCVLAYTEPLAGLLAAGYFYALRRGRVAPVVGLGLLSGLVRPTGPLLGVAGLVLLVRPRRPGDRGLGLLAAAAPGLGTAAYCAWVWWRFGDFLLPYTAQTGSQMRGGVLANPLHALVADTRGGLDWRLNIALGLVALALLVGAARRLPAEYTAWSAVMVLAAFTSSRLHSLPRYLAALFPLVIVLAQLANTGRRERVLAAFCVVSSVGLLALALPGGYVL